MWKEVFGSKVRVAGVALLAACSVFISACGGRSGTGSLPEVPLPKTGTNVMTLTSPAFAFGQTIPVRYTGDGDNLSPELNWTGAPENTQSFALICSDPDAPSGTFIHWVIYNIPGAMRALPAGMPKNPVVLDSAEQGYNSFGRLGYDGPQPPPGKPHRYIFKLYALDTRIKANQRVVDAEFLQKKMDGHVLATAELMGTYQR